MYKILVIGNTHIETSDRINICNVYDRSDPLRYRQYTNIDAIIGILDMDNLYSIDDIHSWIYEIVTHTNIPIALVCNTNNRYISPYIINRVTQICNELDCRVFYTSISDATDYLLEQLDNK